MWATSTFLSSVKDSIPFGYEALYCFAEILLVNKTKARIGNLYNFSKESLHCNVLSNRCFKSITNANYDHLPYLK